MKCHVCGGTFEDRLITVCLPARDGWVFIDELPARVCVQCGEKIFSAEVGRVIDRVQEGAVATSESRRVPVHRYAEALAETTAVVRA